MNYLQQKHTIKGNFIIFEQRLINGYIFIKGTKIQSIIEDIDENQEVILRKIQKYPIQATFTESIIMASAVDLSVALNAAYEPQWNLTEEFTEYNLFLNWKKIRLALQGGTCLLVNKPYCYHAKEKGQSTESYQIEMYKAQVQDLQQNSSIDFIQTSYVDEKSTQNIENLIKEGCYIFQMFLHKTFLQEIEPISHPKNCDKIFTKIKNNNSILIAHLQYNTEKDFSLSSPFRQRLNQDRKTELLDNFPIGADGIKGDLSSADSESSSQNEPHSPINLLITQQFPNKEERQNKINLIYTDEYSPVESEGKFCKYSKNVAKRKQHQLIARAELMSYRKEITISADQDSSETSIQESFIFPPSPQSQIQQSRFQSPDSKKNIIELKPRTRSLSGLLQRRKTSFQQQKIQNPPSSFKLSIINANNNTETEFPSPEIETKSEERNKQMNVFKTDYLYFLAFKPDLWERDAVQFMYNALLQWKKQGESGLNILMNGFSSALTIGKLIHLRKKFGGTNQISIQLAYPFLFYDCESVPNGGTIYKDDIPFRSKENKLLLQRAIQTNWIQSVGSNHLYVDPALKFINEGDFRRAFSGLTCIGLQIQTTWTAIWSCANRHTHIDLNTCRQSLYQSNDSNFRRRIITKLLKLQRIVGTEPADFIKLPQYGRLEKGSLANFVVWDPFSFQKRDLSISQRFDPKLHILNNQILLGRIDAVYFKGDLAYERNDNQLIQIRKCKGQNIIRSKQTVI